jgi:exodeoxyribonuclease VII large subunit
MSNLELDFRNPDSAEGHEVFRVSELTRAIRRLLEENLRCIWVEGEISNFMRHSSGHTYFTLKDDGAQIRCVIWKSARFHFPYSDADGMRVVAYGTVTVYEKGGQYQLTVETMKPLGVGELQLAFEKLKARLAAEGLFDPSRKKPLPAYPREIALVTSPTGAAVRDMISVITRRYPLARIVLFPVKVQGPGASAEIAAALDYLNAWGVPDVIIAGRGGGSLEDLWAFNEEETARAIARSRIPVVSAVGHEIDFTIADFAADLRAPTPSVAGELVVPDKADLLKRIRSLCRSITTNMLRHTTRRSQELVSVTSSYGLRRVEGRLREYMQRLDNLTRMQMSSMERRLESGRAALSGLAGKLDVLSPVNTLKRGYSIARTLPGREILRDASRTAPGAKVEVLLARGRLRAVVEEVEAPHPDPPPQGGRGIRSDPPAQKGSG